LIEIFKLNIDQSILNEIKKKSLEKVIYTSVVCDLLHVGHINLFKQAKSLGDILIVGVISDLGVESYKRNPIISFEQRLEVVSSIKYVDFAIKQETRSGTENMKKLGNISLLIRGDDDEIKDEVEYIKSIGGEFIRIPYTKGVSTSKIIRKINQKNN
tara:strand:+ start:14879 stop:15349 length:471 start_codon:yes stop_codon:yes gene_type:complete